MPEPYSWPLDPDALTFVPALALAYVLVTRRVRTERWRYLCFAGALALLLIVFATPLDTLALNYVLTAHFLQNVVLAEWAPALFVLALPPELARRARIPMGLALPLWLATYFVWHIPHAYDYALSHGAVLHLEHATYFVAGAVMWWPVIHGSARPQSKALYLFAAFVLASPLGLLLALVPDPVYGFYDARPTVWGLSHVADQQIAGTTMAAEQAVVLFAAFTYWFLRFFREEERLARNADQHSTGNHQQRRRDEPASHRL